MTIERLSFPKGIVIDTFKGCLADQIFDVVKHHLAEAIVLPSGVHHLFFPPLSRFKLPFVIVNRAGRATCFTLGHKIDQDAREIEDLKLRAIRIPEDHTSYSLTALVVLKNKHKDRKLKLFEHLIYTPGPSPE